MKYAKVSNGLAREVQDFESDPGEPWVLCGDAGPGWIQTGDGFVAQGAVVPAEITMRQARLVLNAGGYIVGINAAIAAMEQPQKSQAEIEWEYSNTVQRHNGFVSQLGPALGLTAEQIDALFIAGATL